MKTNKTSKATETKTVNYQEEFESAQLVLDIFVSSVEGETLAARINRLVEQLSAKK